MTRSFLLQSRLSTCPRSSSSASRREPRFASRSWRNSWWKYRRSCHFPRCGGLWSRPWTFQFRWVVGDTQTFKVFSEDRGQQVPSRSLIFPVEVFKVLALDRVRQRLRLFPLQPVLDDDAEEPGEGVFRTFPRPKKSANLASHSGSALLPESSPSTPAAQLAFLVSCSLQAQAEEKRRKEEEEQLAKEKEEAEGDVSAACSAVPAAGADAIPPRHLGTVNRVHVAGGVIKGDDGRMYPFRSSCMELAVGYRGISPHHLGCLHFWIYSHIQRYLVRQWIHVGSL